MRKLNKILFIAAAFALFGTLKTYATTEEISQPDTQAPVFSQNLQTRYIMKRTEDGTIFRPEIALPEVTAVDDVDGSNVTINLQHNVDLSQDGEYQVIYTATDKAGNMSITGTTIIVDGIAPVFAENIENLYYMNKSGIVYDSKHNVVESLPATLTATDSMGAFAGIGVYITTDAKGDIVFLDTIKNTPAENVIEANDILVKVNGENIHGQTPAYVASKVRGAVGTTVELTILRNQKELTLTIERQIVKLYEDEEFVAEPNVDITSISMQGNGIIEITYTATDKAGNTAEFVVKVVIVDETVEEILTTGKEDKDKEKLEDVTTSGTPPQDLEKEISTEEKLEEEIKSEETDGTEKASSEKEEKVETEVEVEDKQVESIEE